MTGDDDVEVVCAVIEVVEEDQMKVRICLLDA